jgi:hypothetical protein
MRIMGGPRGPQGVSPADRVPRGCMGRVTVRRRVAVRVDRRMGATVTPRSLGVIRTPVIAPCLAPEPDRQNGEGQEGVDAEG